MSEVAIDHMLTPLPVCPQCGEQIDDPWDFNWKNGEVDAWCPSCDQPIRIVKNVRTTYTTSKRG